MKKELQVALVGNPNTGKTSLFNALTGLNQQVGNYPGITVDKKTGSCRLDETHKMQLVDLPGTYSLTPSSLDEAVVSKYLLDTTNPNYPDLAIIVAEVDNLKRNLLLFSQVQDLKIPSLLVINMADMLEKKGVQIEVAALEKALDTKVILCSTRSKKGIAALKQSIITEANRETKGFLNIEEVAPEFFAAFAKENPEQNLYAQWLASGQDAYLPEDESAKKSTLIAQTSESDILKIKHKETVKRYQKINQILKTSYQKDPAKATSLRKRLDRIATHGFWGYVLFFGILTLIFQALFAWSDIPMTWIDESFGAMADWVKDTLPAGVFTDLLSDGIIAGIGGVVIFVPQIAFLFLFLGILEETGYMSRVVFLMDKIMRRFGLNGKSVIPLISGTACSIPAIMAARNIENWKERLITILVTPFTTCAARLPVYVILIDIIIPNESFYGFNIRGLSMTILYLLGFALALLFSWVLDKIIDAKSKSYFVIEMPDYKAPLFKNIGIYVYEKTKIFVVDAGKIILAISIVLWFLGNIGISDTFHNAESTISERMEKEGFTTYEKEVMALKIKNYSNRIQEIAKKENSTLSASQIQDSIASKRPEFRSAITEDAIAGMKLEHSILGAMGKAIEPIVAPLGYDWKIGVALVSSFAAREVFVGSLATIYSIGSEDAEASTTTREVMATAYNKNTGMKTFTFATGISLLLFYAFAMQCMSTLAIVKRETNSWKWPVVQFVGMGLLAYISAFIAYQILA